MENEKHPWEAYPLFLFYLVLGIISFLAALQWLPDSNTLSFQSLFMPERITTFFYENSVLMYTLSGLLFLILAFAVYAGQLWSVIITIAFNVFTLLSMMFFDSLYVSTSVLLLMNVVYVAIFIFILYCSFRCVKHPFFHKHGAGTTTHALQH